MTAVRLALIVTILAVVASGCGEGGEDRASSPSPLSRAEFVERANEICMRERAGLRAEGRDYLRRRGSEVANPQVLYLYMVKFVVLRALEMELFEIGRLEPPRGDKDAIEEMADAQQLAIDAVAVRESAPSIDAVKRHFAGAGRLLRAYGLSTCAFDPRSDWWA